MNAICTQLRDPMKSGTETLLIFFFKQEKQCTIWVGRKCLQEKFWWLNIDATVPSVVRKLYSKYCIVQSNTAYVLVPVQEVLFVQFPPGVYLRSTW